MVDLTKKFGAFRHQGNTAYCFAFAAADLLGAEAGVKPPDQVSSLDLVSSFISLRKDEMNSLHKRITFENVPLNNDRVLDSDALKTGSSVPARHGGYENMALAKALQDGKVCLEKEVPSQTLMYPDMKARGSLDPIQSYLENQVAERSGHEAIVRLGQVVKEKGKPANCTNLVSSEAIFETELLPVINDWAAAKLRQSIKKSCRQPISLKPSEVHTALFLEEGDKERSLQIMNKLLSNGHSFVLALPSKILVTGQTERSEILDHSTVVTGRRWNPKKNRCEIQIRNSYGRQCFQLSSEVECRNGHSWVAQEAVANSDHRITYLTTR